MSAEVKEFDGERAQMYGNVHQEFPNARAEEIEINMGYFNPKVGEEILEIGSGSGLYTKILSKMLGDSGQLFATDPSKD